MEFFIKTICPCDIVFSFDESFYFLNEAMPNETAHLGFICLRKMVPSQKILHFFYVSQLCGVHVSLVWFKDAVHLLSVCCHLSLSISDCVSFDFLFHLLLVFVMGCLSCLFSQMTCSLSHWFVVFFFLFKLFTSSLWLFSVFYSYWACLILWFYGIHVC